MSESTIQVPSDEEIRAHIARAWRRRPPAGPSAEVSWEDGWDDLQQIADDLFDLDDIRESELTRLTELVRGALEPVRFEARRAVNDALVDALRTFLVEHPGAPRRVGTPR